MCVHSFALSELSHEFLRYNTIKCQEANFCHLMVTWVFCVFFFRLFLVFFLRLFGFFRLFWFFRLFSFFGFLVFSLGVFLVLLTFLYLHNLNFFSRRAFSQQLREKWQFWLIIYTCRSPACQQVMVGKPQGKIYALLIGDLDKKFLYFLVEEKEGGGEGYSNHFLHGMAWSCTQMERYGGGGWWGGSTFSRFHVAPC